MVMMPNIKNILEREKCQVLVEESSGQDELQEEVDNWCLRFAQSWKIKVFFLVLLSFYLDPGLVMFRGNTVL